MWTYQIWFNNIFFKLLSKVRSYQWNVYPALWCDVLSEHWPMGHFFIYLTLTVSQGLWAHNNLLRCFSNLLKTGYIFVPKGVFIVNVFFQKRHQTAKHESVFNPAGASRWRWVFVTYWLCIIQRVLMKPFLDHLNCNRGKTGVSH